MDADMLTLPWQYKGLVMPGRKLGRRIGSPTINLLLRDNHAPHGIFVGLVKMGSKGYPAVIHVGPRPAIGDMRPIIEAHILVRPPARPRAQATVVCLHRLRSIRAFKTLPALRRQIRKDISQAQKWWRS